MGKASTTMDQYTAEIRDPAWLSVMCRSVFMMGNIAETISRSM